MDLLAIIAASFKKLSVEPMMFLDTVARTSQKGVRKSKMVSLKPTDKNGNVISVSMSN